MERRSSGNDAGTTATGGSLPPVKGLIPASLIEWEGRLSCSIFLPGCNFRCPFCHARDLVAASGEIDPIPLSAVLDHLDRNRGWIDGVVVSGGEATLHRTLPQLIATLRDHVPTVKVDTNGSQPMMLERLLDGGLIECVAMDFKAPFHKYAQAAGSAVDCDAVRATIALLRTRGIEREFRTTVVPGLHDIEDIVEIGRELGSTETLILQQFAPLNCLDSSYLDRRPYNRDQLREMAAAAAPFVRECRLRGDPSSKGDGR